MSEPMSDITFKGMTLLFKLRDFLFPRQAILQEAGIRPGFTVLDYGCGPGSYVLGSAAMVGPMGRICALDIHPLAVQSVQNIARRHGLTNVQAILSDCETGLPDDSVNVVLLYDVLHMLSDPGRILAELHRVLKPNGVLSLLDPHMKRDVAVARVTANGLFKLIAQGRKTLSFCRQK